MLTPRPAEIGRLQETWKCVLAGPSSGGGPGSKAGG